MINRKKKRLRKIITKNKHPSTNSDEALPQDQTNHLYEIARRLDLGKLKEFDEAIQKTYYIAAAQQKTMISFNQIIGNFKKDKEFMVQFSRYEPNPCDYYKE